MGALLKEKEKDKEKNTKYAKISAINGKHPFQQVFAPGEGYINYSVRSKKNGNVLFFNFVLAKEIGLIEKDHPHQLNPELEQTLLDAFAITIINEYDIIHKVHIPANEIHPNPYMATRYLQLQHPNKKGKTSGDGRSIWNGVIESNGKIYDVSSCGTGATSLSPASAIKKTFFKTGDPNVSYGCGCADSIDGYGAAVLSEIFNGNKIGTERTLAIINFNKQFSINVRVGENLIRPSHFFVHLKQNNLMASKKITDYYIDREIKNGNYPKLSNYNQRYQYFLEQTVKTFSSMAAKFESEYIFCWLDWDGDNILTNGGIIDFGSVRQFGLFHHKYRYDDVDRFSTTILEQKQKARYIVQTFIQLIDFIKSGHKKNIKKFAKHYLLKSFDRMYEEKKKELLLKKIGLNNSQTRIMLKNHRRIIEKFQESFCYFEKQVGVKGSIKVEDGINHNAIFCMRDLLRELPKRYSQFNNNNNSIKTISANLLLKIMRSSYASNKDMQMTPYRLYHAHRLQRYYIEILKILCKLKHNDVKKILSEIIDRSSMINKIDRTTGNGIIYVTEEMIKTSKHLSFGEFHKVTEEFIANQIIEKNKINFLNESDTNVDLESAFSNLNEITANRDVLKTSTFGDKKFKVIQVSEKHKDKKKDHSSFYMIKVIKKLLRIVHDNRDSL
ncbi:MAG: hypothetical protein HQK49_10040 [Oligoflexia bacterium]|nr:hypothetical protein [Oligoflexia bacterium]